MALSLCGQALTETGSTGTLLLTGAPSSATVALFAGLTFAPTPIAGGTLVPNPPLLIILLPSGSGTIAIPVAGGGGPAATVYVQAASHPASGIQFSNALEVVIGS
jgi:hypothetical protein